MSRALELTLVAAALQKDTLWQHLEVYVYHPGKGLPTPLTEMVTLGMSSTNCTANVRLTSAEARQLAQHLQQAADLADLNIAQRKAREHAQATASAFEEHA